MMTDFQNRCSRRRKEAVRPCTSRRCLQSPRGPLSRAIFHFPAFGFVSNFEIRISDFSLPQVSGFILPIFALLLLLAVGCQSRPAVRAVWSAKHLEAIGPVDQEFFLTDRASRIRSTSRSLPVAEQGEEFRVSWRGRDVELVQFEYRQMNAPDKVTAQDFRTNRRHSTTFWIRGDEFLKAGAVSAWRVTLWRDGELLAQKHSMLW